MTSLEKQVKPSIQERTRAFFLKPTDSAKTKENIIKLIGQGSTLKDNSSVQSFINKLAEQLAAKTAELDIEKKKTQPTATTFASGMAASVKAAGGGNAAALKAAEKKATEQDAVISKLEEAKNAAEVALTEVKSKHKEDLQAIYDALTSLQTGGASAREILDNALKKSEGN